jgi:hypothetical protein
LYNNGLFAPWVWGIPSSRFPGRSPEKIYKTGQAMTEPLRDPDELSHEKETAGTNYHDEEQEIQNDEEPNRAAARPAPRRKTERRPPPRKRHYED